MIMRALSAILLVLAFVFVLAFLVQPALAQGVKDPPNYPQTNVQGGKKAQPGQNASRPTAINNVAAGSLPAGAAAQRVWRDGKLVTIPRQ